MAESEKKAVELASMDLSNMPVKASKPPQQMRLEIVMTEANKNIVFIVENGEVANTFLDSYNRLVEVKAVMARWSIGASMYSIPMANILFVRMEKHVVQDAPGS